MLIDKNYTGLDVFLLLISKNNNVVAKKEDVKKILSIDAISGKYNTRVDVLFDSGINKKFEYNRINFENMFRSKFNMDMLTEYLWKNSRTLLSNDRNVSYVICENLTKLINNFTNVYNYWLYDIDDNTISATVTPDFEKIIIKFNSLVFTGELIVDGFPVTRAYDKRVPDILNFGILNVHSTDSITCFEQHFYDFINSIGLTGGYSQVQGTYNIIYNETEDLELNSVIIECKENKSISVVKKFNKIDLFDVIDFNSLKTKLKNIVRVNKNDRSVLINESIKCFSECISSRVSCSKGPYVETLNKITCEYTKDKLNFWIPSVVYKHNYTINLN